MIKKQALQGIDEILLGLFRVDYLVQNDLK